MKNEVTCLYCSHCVGEYDEKERNAYPQVGICRLKGEPRFWYADVCENFVLKSGLHTTKSYPTK